MKGSLLHERFLESPPYDLNEMKASAEGILRVLESMQHIAKNAEIIVSQNNSRSRSTRNDDRMMKYEERMTKPPRNESIDKRKITDYSCSSAKRFKADDDDFDCIFTIPQEKIFVELKDQNIFQQPKPYSILKHMKDKAQFYIFHNDYGHTMAASRNLYS